MKIIHMNIEAMIAILVPQLIPEDKEEDADKVDK